MASSSSSSKKRIAIIGSGASGLAAIKCCKEEGLEPVCFERTDSLGGLWHFTDNPIEGQGCVMKSTVINTSKEMMCYSDFPIPEHYPIFMHNSQVLKYFHLYADNFKLKDVIRFNTEVLLVKRADDFVTTGRWFVRSRNRLSQDETEEVFDGVMICSGHHAEKYDPELPGLNNFKGKVVHSHDYRHPETMLDKRVVVIGIGNSGGDIAVELSRTASQVFLSTRRGTWILNRVSDNGLPIDMLNLNRINTLLIKYAGMGLTNQFMKRQLNQRMDHDIYGLTPEYMPFEQHPMVNDELPNRIICGSVKIKTDIKRFTETGVEFIDGTEEKDLDIVIKATGYSFGFPYVEKGVLDVEENHVQLYKYMYNPDLEHDTLAVIGCFQPLGAIMPVAELQCRLATRVFKGDVKLPPKGDQWADIRHKEADMAQRFVKSRRHTIQIDYVPFSDELASLVGCSPDYMSLIKSDPILGFKAVLGPVTPYHYRLNGHKSWHGASTAIRSQWARIKAPLKTRQLPKGVGSDSQIWKYFLLSLVIFFVFRYLFF